MENKELMEILKKTNEKLGKKVDDEILASILSLIMLNPLDDDRNICQDRIKFLIQQKVVINNDN